MSYQPGIPLWSHFYAVRMAALRAAAEACEDEPAAPTWATLADVCGPDAADALDVLRDAWARGRFPDDRMAGFNFYRLTFARWLVRQGILSEF